MSTRVSYPYEIKVKAIDRRLAGIPMRQVLNWWKHGWVCIKMEKHIYLNNLSVNKMPS